MVVVVDMGGSSETDVSSSETLSMIEREASSPTFWLTGYRIWGGKQEVIES